MLPAFAGLSIKNSYLMSSSDSFTNLETTNEYTIFSVKLSLCIYSYVL